ncbi:MAG: hypothetical protein HZA90_25470 [Verrucomicrobia bacterium]|nr:hypothetical protein [Verrucomicrobiota bacterium]
MKRSMPFWIVGLALTSGLALWLFLRSSPESDALRLRTLATRALAEALVKQQAGRRVLVVSNPFAQRSGVDKAIRATEAVGVRGLKEGFGNSMPMEPLAFPALKPEAERDPRSVSIDPETTTPLSYLMAEGAFDALASAHPHCDLVVSLVGLPASLHREKCWQAEGPPRFGLLLPDLRPIGDAAAVRRAVKTGKLAAFVLQKPGTPGNAAQTGSDSAAEFAQRFLVVTAENIDEVMRAFPQLFPGN